MKCMKRIERSFSVTSLLIVFSAISVLYQQRVALSQSNYLVAADPGDFICYMQTSNGQIINLSRLCGNSKTFVSTISTVDQQFLQRYQGFLEQRAKGSPMVQALISQAQQNPQSVIQRAQAVCTAIRTGQPRPTSGQVADDLFQTMAPKHYCPELDD